ncbi:non-specific lipid transfer protein GPI-anchored 31-like [Zingiber officinale]|uniref:Bifunctional inhibitor/plant lipid transfer protein/seed storage helical domain-containing protein n=1 Tax=Zingiber officinale TaxID=94328 RepID=A0A8J5HDK0_ZINOF|nr:non-specific lipid transfer protein GPI-anchored 31-like [Zingiber officinale]KAG6524165.1 hypothetical protein ZIOFF_014056 [Zingiber officinale]
MSFSLPLLLLLCFNSGVHVSQAAPPVAAPSPSLDCSSEVINLIDCLSFVSNGSTAAKPDAQCCSGLRKVIKEAASCLCYLSSQGQAFNVNVTKALTLPSACGVSTPSASNCNISIAGAPGAAPVSIAGAPAGAPALSPSRGAPSSVSTGVPSSSPTNSTAAALPAPSFEFLSCFAVFLWLYYQSH